MTNAPDRLAAALEGGHRIGRALGPGTDRPMVRCAHGGTLVDGVRKAGLAAPVEREQQ